MKILWWIAKKEDMDTEIIHDNWFDTLSNCEQKWSTTQFQTDEIGMNKIDLLIMQKSKLFFQLDKKKEMQVNMARLIFSGEESVSGWINRSTKDIKFRQPKRLQNWKNGIMVIPTNVFIIWTLKSSMQKLKHCISVLIFSMKRQKSKRKCFPFFKILLLQQINITIY